MTTATFITEKMPIADVATLARLLGQRLPEIAYWLDCEWPDREDVYRVRIADAWTQRTAAWHAITGE